MKSEFDKIMENWGRWGRNGVDVGYPRISAGFSKVVDDNPKQGTCPLWLSDEICLEVDKCVSALKNFNELQHSIVKFHYVDFRKGADRKVFLNEIGGGMTLGAYYRELGEAQGFLKGVLYMRSLL